MADWLEGRQEYRYGRYGTPTLRALESAIAEIEGAHNACLFPSGLAAITSTLLILLQSGDHLLVTDSVYSPTRKFCQGILAAMGIETSYYDPLIGAGIKELIRPNTKLIFTESPGSQTMEVQDIPAITAAAKAAGVITVIDNTWGAGHYFKAIDHGCDVSVQAATKYIVGHSDAMLGTAAIAEHLWERYRSAYLQLGQHVGPDDVYLGLRGLRTIDVRMQRHQENALKVAAWLQTRSEIKQVLYPALPGCDGHDLWKRDFKGACGLFSIVPENRSREAIAALIDDLQLFGLGASWGGFESLVLPFDPGEYRTATNWPHKGFSVRLHIGLEDPDDLIADLATGFERMNKL